MQSWHHRVRLNTHTLSRLHNNISTRANMWLHSHDHKQTHGYSMIVWVRKMSDGCSLANLLLFVSLLLFSQTLSSWVPFSPTRLSALPALLNKPFTHLFIPFFRRRWLPATNRCCAPRTWQSEGPDNKEEAACSTAKETGKTYCHYERASTDQSHIFLLLHVA